MKLLNKSELGKLNGGQIHLSKEQENVIYEDERKILNDPSNEKNWDGLRADFKKYLGNVSFMGMSGASTSINSIESGWKYKTGFYNLGGLFGDLNSNMFGGHTPIQ